MRELELAELERRARAGEARAFGAVLRQHQHDLRGLVWSMVRDSHQVDDIMQAAFEKAFRNVTRFKGDSSMKTWLQSICYRAAIDHIRYAGRRRHADVDEFVGMASADDVARRVEDRDRFTEVMTNLDPETRALLMLTAGLGYTQGEAAEITGLPIGTVGSRLSRARDRLRKDLS
ncbi:MAG: RNA polymerase sigma factor [Actinomycetota bacterium]